ncbi:MAG: hypothetical protein CO118_07825 [Flavobacteriales bacterium CG_4_9_14_3_um_filter_32_8]|nr:MAG: hypothetical protein CO118_07825 [Flavobacteriales bacterium CG_4_9_14_3_um_filter_32_8]
MNTKSPENHFKTTERSELMSTLIKNKKERIINKVSKTIKLLTMFLSLILSTPFVKAQTFNVEVAKSKLEWKSTKVTGEHSGKVQISKGNVVITNGKITGGEFIINMKNITITDTDDKDKQKDIVADISGKTFFNVAAFPTAKFVIKGYADGFLFGDLTIKGNTVLIKFKTQFKIVGNLFVAKTASFTIDRRKWKLKLSNWLKESAVDNELKFSVYIEANIK